MDYYIGVPTFLPLTKNTKVDVIFFIVPTALIFMFPE